MRHTYFSPGASSQEQKPNWSDQMHLCLLSKAAVDLSAKNDAGSQLKTDTHVRSARVWDKIIMLSLLLLLQQLLLIIVVLEIPMKKKKFKKFESAPTFASV